MSYKDRSCSPILLESGLKSFLGTGHNYPLINGKFQIFFYTKTNIYLHIKLDSVLAREFLNNLPLNSDIID